MNQFLDEKVAGHKIDVLFMENVVWKLFSCLRTTANGSNMVLSKLYYTIFKWVESALSEYSPLHWVASVWKLKGKKPHCRHHLHAMFIRKTLDNLHAKDASSYCFEIQLMLSLRSIGVEGPNTAGLRLTLKDSSVILTQSVTGVSFHQTSSTAVYTATPCSLISWCEQTAHQFRIIKNQLMGSNRTSSGCRICTSCRTSSCSKVQNWISNQAESKLTKNAINNWSTTLQHVTIFDIEIWVTPVHSPRCRACNGIVHGKAIAENKIY